MTKRAMLYTGASHIQGDVTTARSGYRRALRAGHQKNRSSGLPLSAKARMQSSKLLFADKRPAMRSGGVRCQM